MKTPAVFAFAVLIGALLFPASMRADALDNAHRAFAEGHYHASTLGYQAVLAQNGYSAPVLFDLGNSHYREGDFAEAILAFRQAHWLSPGDPDIAANLQLAQKQAGVAVTEPRWSDKVIGVLNPSGWAWVGSAAWTLLCASLLARTIWPQRRPLFFLSGATGALVLCAAIAAGVFSSGQLREAVVVDRKASARISPFPDAQPVFSPPAGETVMVRKVYHDFLLVTDQAGHAGWISLAQVAPIIPARAKEAPRSGSDRL